MDTKIWIEIFGYVGSALTIVSMLMASIVKLRIINTVGSGISGAYALIIGSYPLAILSFSLVIINIYNLFKLFKPKNNYDLVVGKSDDAFVSYFLNRYREDIQSHFPSFDVTNKGDTAYIVCCNGTPAGITLGCDKGDGVIDLILDYSTPTYRDCSVARYLHSKLPKQGVKKLLYRQGSSMPHVSYLKKVGYTEENGIYVKKL